MDDHQHDPVSHDKVAELKEAFALFDYNGTGSITKEELRVIIMSLLASDFSEEELQRILEEADADGSGSVDFAEFVSLMVVANGWASDDQTDGLNNPSAKEMMALFSDHDPRGTSFVDRNQFESIVRSGDSGLSATEAEEMWNDAVKFHCVRKDRVHYKKFIAKLVVSESKRR
jgi:calmodulin